MSETPAPRLSARRLRHRLAAVLSALGLVAALLAAGAPAASAEALPPVISEVMANPASAEDDWEWVELFNPGSVDIDLAGWVLDDNNGSAQGGANIAAGLVPAGGSAVLFNVDDVSVADFEAAWGTGINLVAVTGWSAGALNNGGDTVGLWSSFADYDGDNQTQANAVVSATYGGTSDGISRYLTDLADQDSFTNSVDGVSTPVGDTYLSAAAGGNVGAEAGSPGGGFAGPELFFTQYVEGSSNNKAIEIANVGSSPVSLDGYTVETYFNGSSTPGQTADLTGSTIGGSDVFVIYNSNANADIAAVGDLAAAVATWNGDDAVVLRNPGGDVVDAIGQVGFDPGSSWIVDGVGTQNATLCRDEGVTSGDTNPSDVFDPSVEWLALASDDITGLGQLGACEDDPPPPDQTAPVISEIMYDSASAEDDWEWVELFNPGSVDIDLAGWVLDDNNGSAQGGANIAAGLVPAGGSAVLFNVDDVSVADFEAAWGTGINLVAVTGWSAGALNNGGDTVGLWSSFADYDGDNQTQANAVVSVQYPDSASDGQSIHLTNLADQDSFIASVDGAATPVGDTYTSVAGGGNDGGDAGSPGGSFPGPELFFTQYVEGSSNNKAIEIANVGSSPVSLDGYTVETYFNGSSTPGQTADLTGSTIGGSDVFVIYNSNANADIAAVGDLAAAVATWNGDDAVVLRNPGGDVVDAIGQVGFDPGSSWIVDGVGTQNATLCRDEGVTSGDTNPSDVFDPSVEWLALASDDITGLGQLGACEDDPPPPGDAVLIHEVQGDGAASPLVGQSVEVQAIVTSMLEDDDALDGFYLQEEDVDVDADPATSEGLFVFCRGNCPAGLATGDQVTVNGTVGEFNGATQINMQSGTAVIDSSGNPLPTPATIDLPAPTGTDAEATFESVEGMLAQFVDKLIVSEYFQLGRFGEVVLTADARPAQFTDGNAPSVAGYAAHLAEIATRQIVLDDNTTNQNDAIFGPLNNEPYAYPTPGLSLTNRFRGGDSITGMTGVLEWSFNQWRVRPVDTESYTFVSENPAPAAPADVGGSLKVASFNVLNYFTTLDTGSPDCGPSGGLDCRGANSAAELARQRDKIVSALAAIDADIVGLVEIQNDEVSVADLAVSVNAVVGAGTYAHVDTGTIGGDAIKVAFIYKPSTVSLVGNHAILDSSVDPNFIDTKNRPVLIQTFSQVATGEVLTVAVNHLKSKGSPCDDVGDPGLNDGQANCNLTRTSAATAMAQYLATDPTGSGDPDVLIIGDLNAYAMEDPIVALENAGYTDLIETFEAGAYSFVFDGQTGYLDHALANGDLFDQVTGVTTWHINADEINLFDYNDDIQDPGEQSFRRESNALPIYAADPFRSSDHDPLIVGLDLTAGVDPGPTCGGLPATIVGTEGRDRIRGTSGPDVIVALGGNDIINGLGGDDIICAGDGNDRVFGNGGNDTIFGEGDNDRLYGSGGEDEIDGGDGRDIISGGTQNDVLTGGDDADRVYGSAGDDMMSGGPGNDVLVGSAGDDEISGGDGDDIVNGGSGEDDLSGDDGDDRVIGGGSNDFLDGGADIDRLIGSGGLDTCVNGETTSGCEF